MLLIKLKSYLLSFVVISVLFDFYVYSSKVYSFDSDYSDDSDNNNNNNNNSDNSFSFSSNDYLKAIKSNNIELLKDMELIGIKMKLSNNELQKVINTFYSVDYYETVEFLLKHIKLNDKIAYNLIIKVLFHLTTPTTKEQQQIQLNIYKKLCNYSLVKDFNLSTKYLLIDHFDLIVKSLNIPLINFIVIKFNIKINRLFINTLQMVVIYLIYNKNNNEFAYEMFDYLLRKDVDIYKRDSLGRFIYFHINRITEKTTKNTLLLKLSKYVPKQVSYNK